MINIDNELQKYGLNREQYAQCLRDIKDKINGTNDMDWVEICRKYNLEIHSDTLRKASQTIFGGAFVSEYKDECNVEQNATKCYLTELKTEKHNIEIERQKLRDGKREYNKWLREEARDKLICEEICNAISALEPLEIPAAIGFTQGEREGILCFADTHYGVEFDIKGLGGESINSYSPEIFESRMEELLDATIQKIQKEGFRRIKVYSLGDEIDGILRVSQLMKLRYGVVESTIKYADYICRWLTALSKYVHIDFQMVMGNHTELRQIGQPKGTFVDDNMSKVIREFINVRMADNPNFRLITNDSGLIYDKVCDCNVLAIHGEVKNLSNAIHSFSNMYNKTIDILIGGHFHHYKAETIGQNRDVISVPSIIGIDNYSMQLGKVSNPGATFLIIEEGKGVVEQSTFKFDN